MRKLLVLFLMAVSITSLSAKVVSVSYTHLEDMTVAIKGRTELIITMRTKPDELDEVTVVAFAKQKKESVIDFSLSANT